MQVFSIIFLCLFITQSYAEIFDGMSVSSLNDYSERSLDSIADKKSLIVVFSKDCAHCKSHFQSLHKCYNSSSKIIPISVDSDRKKVKKYWRSMNLPFPAWMGSKTFNKKFSSLKKNLPYSYFHYQNKYYPIGAGPISCERISQLSSFKSKA